MPIACMGEPYAIRTISANKTCEGVKIEKDLFIFLIVQIRLKSFYFFYLFICVKRKSAHRKGRKKKRNTHTHTKKGLQSCINNSRAPEKNMFVPLLIGKFACCFITPNPVNMARKMQK